MGTNIKVIGQKELDRLFRVLPKEVSHSVQQAAHVAAAKPLIETAKRLAPDNTGTLEESIGAVRIPLKRASVIGEVHVGPRRRGKYRGFHSHLVELGTKPRTLTGRGKYPAGTERGVMPAKPFMRPAFQQTRQQVIDSITTQTAKKLVARMKRELGANFIR